MASGNGRTWLTVGTALLGLAGWLSQTASADGPTGLEAVSAIETSLVNAIAAAEKSVVAIARVNENLRPLEARIDPFGQTLRPNMPEMPDSPKFIPNEYATGVVIDANGLILTAHHVLKDHSDYYVTTIDRKVTEATVIAADPRSDLAVLKIKARGLTPIKFGDADKLRKGQIVVALGNPYAIARDGQPSASWGIVANLARKDSVDHRERPALHQLGTLIHTDAKLNLGTSGGALINLAGEMVGLTVAVAATSGYEQSTGFAIPVDATFKRVIARLRDGKEAEFGFLGVGVADLAGVNAAMVPAGVVVNSVVPGTPAHKAGLASNDIITKVGDRKVRDTDEFMLEVGSYPAQSTVELTWVRGGRQIVGQAVLAKYWVGSSKIVTTPEPAWRGARVDFVTASRAFNQMAATNQEHVTMAVLVSDVEPDSPAWQAGLRAEMLINQANGKNVSTPAEFRRAVAESTGPVSIRLISADGAMTQRTIEAPAE